MVSDLTYNPDNHVSSEQLNEERENENDKNLTDTSVLVLFQNGTYKTNKN